MSESYSRKRGATSTGAGSNVPADQFIAEAQLLSVSGDANVTTSGTGAASTPQAMQEAYASLVRFVEDSLDLYKVLFMTITDL